jgi:hypothetical protein
MIGEVPLVATEVFQLLVCLLFAKCRKQEALQQSVTNGGIVGNFKLIWSEHVSPA